MDSVLAFPILRFDRPTFLTHAPDASDRLFVLEQRGKIHVFPNSNAVTSAKVFLDISSKQKLPVAGEQDLLGIAFHPDYKNNGFFYVNYIAGSPSRSVIARYRVNVTDPDLPDLASERILLEVNQPASNHNGGMLAFGPDDLLYISLGDGGGAGDQFGNGQNRTTLERRCVDMQSPPLPSHSVEDQSKALHNPSERAKEGAPGDRPASAECQGASPPLI